LLLVHGPILKIAADDVKNNSAKKFTEETEGVSNRD
jgi:hypothetical protein